MEGFARECRPNRSPRSAPPGACNRQLGGTRSAASSVRSVGGALVSAPEPTPIAWSRQFGLATTPLFEGDEHAPPGEHHVLLDGGSGTFSLSISGEELWRSINVAAWAWSSDIP